jgi:hypothetical protein
MQHQSIMLYCLVAIPNDRLLSLHAEIPSGHHSISALEDGECSGQRSVLGAGQGAVSLDGRLAQGLGR